jgi:4-hydroxy-3-methylbut-2-enyl diphosphate reductase
MCFGVRDAIALAARHVEAAPLTILGDLVHNRDVVAALEAKGVATVHEPTDATTHTVMITAHGASQRMLTRVRALGLNVVEATCPLVRVAHDAVLTLQADGYHPVIIGLRDHVEVRGLIEDLEEFDIVSNEDDVATLAAHARYGIAAQTTQPIERVKYLVDLIRRRFPHAGVRFIDTVCLPTKQRQVAAVELARRSDVVVVVGGVTSNNTRELVRTCSGHGARVHQVENSSDLHPEWFVNAQTVGITAGTSTPEHVIDSVEARIRMVAG